MNRAITCMAWLVIVGIIGYLMIAGRGLLIPLVIAVFLWNLLNTINQTMLKVPGIGARMPFAVSMSLSLLVVAIMLGILITIITNNVNGVIAASSRYQENLTRIFNMIDNQYHIKGFASFDAVLKSLSVQNILVNIYAVFTTIAGSAILIILYIAFLFVEQHFFRQKMDMLCHQLEHRDLVDSITTHIAQDMQTYLGLKTLMSFMTAISSWAIMKWVGLDFAEFWALLIFFLNYIPNLGAIIATAFPMMLALIQFESWVPFVVITIGITTIQFVIGSLIEPRFISKSLNLSPLVILISLGLWGSIWGILGMFLSAPITVMMMIVFAHFDATRPIAILLSQDGYVKKNYQKPVVIS